MNRTLGWALVSAGFVLGAWLDPWALEQPQWGLVVRESQGVVLAMGLLQLLAGHLIRTTPMGGPGLRSASALTALGAAVYAAGYVLRLVWLPAGWAILLGALLNAAGFHLLATQAARAGRPFPVRVALWVVVFGMGLDALIGLLVIQPELRPAYLGAADELRLRMIRLARVAATALAIQAILFQDLAAGAVPKPLVRWAGFALVFGAAGMPLILTAAAFGPLELKYLLPLPADAVLFGAAVAAWLSRGQPPLVRGGWLLILASMVVGLLLGGFAFNGPLPAPAAYVDYHTPARALTRLGHAYAIVLGLMALFAAQQPGEGRSSTHPAGALLVTGGLLVLLGMAVVAVMPGWSGLLTPGPAIVGLAAAVMARSEAREGPDGPGQRSRTA